jgi:hypothetical protein
MDVLPLLQEEIEKRRREKISIFRSTGETVEKVPPSKKDNLSSEKAGKIMQVNERYIREVKKLKEEGKNPLFHQQQILYQGQILKHLLLIFVFVELNNAVPPS